MGSSLDVKLSSISDVLDKSLKSLLTVSSSCWNFDSTKENQLSFLSLTDFTVQFLLVCEVTPFQIEAALT